MYTNLRVERIENIAVVTLDSPPVNAISFAAYGEIRHAFHQLADDDDLRAVVLTGAEVGESTLPIQVEGSSDVEWQTSEQEAVLTVKESL